MNNIKIVQSGTGKPVPVLILDNGSERLIHSSYDPEKEGQKLASSTCNADIIIAAGMGAGYHLLPLLSNNNLHQLLIFEQFRIEDPSIIALTQQLIQDPRVIYIEAATPELLSKEIHKKFFPFTGNKITTFLLRSIADAFPEYYKECIGIIQKYIQDSAADAAVMSDFGFRWQTGMMKNIARICTSGMFFPDFTSNKPIIIAAAGPSLERNISVIKQSKSIIIACDTSLPALLENEVIPDYVMSLDCQFYSSGHFYKGLPKETTLILDILNPMPFSIAENQPVCFAGSGHPLTAYFSDILPMVNYDSSGGNVASGAVSFSMNFDKVIGQLIGADFSYPSGKSYAAGTYLYRKWNSESCRTNGTEHQNCSGIFSRDFALICDEANTERKMQIYQTDVLKRYKNRFEAAVVHEKKNGTYFYKTGQTPFNKPDFLNFPGIKIVSKNNKGITVTADKNIIIKELKQFASELKNCKTSNLSSREYTALIPLVIHYRIKKKMPEEQALRHTLQTAAFLAEQCIFYLESL